jgi:hypothetical protein
MPLLQCSLQPARTYPAIIYGAVKLLSPAQAIIFVFRGEAPLTGIE